VFLSSPLRFKLAPILDLITRQYKIFPLQKFFFDNFTAKTPPSIKSKYDVDFTHHNTGKVFIILIGLFRGILHEGDHGKILLEGTTLSPDHYRNRYNHRYYSSKDIASHRPAMRLVGGALE
jgi:hypothetical protein